PSTPACAACHAPRAKLKARKKRSKKLITPSARWSRGEARSAPAPAATPKAQMKSPVQAPRPSCHAAQNPPPCARGSKARRIISALIGPGGQATDHPRINPLTIVAPLTPFTVRPNSHPAFRLRLRVVGPHPYQARQIAIDCGCLLNPGEIGRRIEPGKNGVHDLLPGHPALAVTKRDVARPETHVIEPGLFFRAEINYRM